MTFTRSVSLAPAASRARPRFSAARSVWAASPPVTMSPFSSWPTWPATWMMRSPRAIETGVKPCGSGTPGVLRYSMVMDSQSTTSAMRRICVFCGSSPGARPAYGEAAEELGRLLVAERIGLVYGGGKVGLMGRLADAVLAEGGEATGVMPEALVAKEIGHQGLNDLRVVGSMHERKALMADLSDGFVALPGGLGTVEELFEVYTWSQLGLHLKPCALLDVEGYYEGIATFLAHAVQERFLREDHREMLMVERDPRTLVERLRRFEPAAIVPKWIDREETYPGL